VDKFHSSPDLAQQLKIEHSTDCVDTLKLNRKNIPKTWMVKDWRRVNCSETCGSSHHVKMV